MKLVYFSSVSTNTLRFVEKLEMRASRIPLRTFEDTLVESEPFILILPTYGGEKGVRSISPQVMKFLAVPQNRENMRAVIGTGNTNFGSMYCIAADKISAKCGVPVLGRVELMGTQEDVVLIKERIEKFDRDSSS